MIRLNRILLVEHNPNDAELTLEALAERNLANDGKWVHEGEEALDYLFCRRQYAGGDCSDLAVVLLDLKLPKVDGLEGSARYKVREEAETHSSGGPHLFP